MGRADRRARKKANRRLAHPQCESCGYPAPLGEDHDTKWSIGGAAWDGLSIVAWCRRCGHEVCS